MNILHLKYAVEVAKAGSLSKAAEALYMNQPNLSRAIKELEASLGITIFGRSAKGVYVTPEGEEFLGYARKILSQIDEVEDLYAELTDAVARLAGAPKVPGAGVDLMHKLGDTVAAGDLLYRVHASYPADQEFARRACERDSGYRLGTADEVPRVFVEF